MANWSHEETRALLSVWSDEEIQRDLEGAVRNERVYREVSHRLAAMGMSRSAKQCRQKIKKLKVEYRKLKVDSGRGGANIHVGWCRALDTVMGKRAATADNTEHSSNMIVEFTVSDVDTDSPTTEDFSGSCSNTVMPHTLLEPAAYPPQDPHFFSIQLEDVDGPTATSVTSTAVQTSVKDTPLCCWSSTEVQALLTLWANPAVQEELLLNVRNNKVYTHLSAKLASLGFNKAPKKCREKIKKLKQEYKRIKSSCRSETTSTRTSVWFAIMDDVLSSQAAAAKHSRTADPSLPSRSQSFPDMNTNEDIQWLPDEIQVLMTLWAQPNIQKQLQTPAANNRVFTYLSNELALVRFNKTPHQCSLKVNNLIEEYRKIKEKEPHEVVKSDWFTILDGVFGSEEASPEVDSSAVLTQPESPEHEHGNADMLRTAWTSDEVKVLLTRWADESVQKQLRSTQRNERVFAQLSSELATQGFDKTTSQCRSKIKLLKRKYRRVKEQRDSKKPRNRWFAIMDKVLGHHKPEFKQAAEVEDSTPASLQTSQQIIAKTVENLGCHLSLSSLRLLVPTLRLMCAFAWQVVQCCNVVHYGKVEELVGLGTELAPELLTPREKVQLLLRLRARFVLELCRSETTANLPNIKPHLKVIQDLTMGSSCDQEELEELENSKSNFVEVVYTLLEDPEERKMFFQEVFPLHYGQPYQALLNTLVWKFISRLDVLLPIPDIKQTAEWLSTAPSIMEECGRLVLESHELKALLHFHQQRSGNTNKHDSLTQNIFLPRLSLPPKAKMKQLAFEQPEISTGDEAEDQYGYSEDEEPVEENQSDEKSTLEDCSEDNEDLKLKDEHNDDLTAANCSNTNNNSLSRQKVCSLCPCSDSQVSDILQHIRVVQEPSPLPSEEPVKGSSLQKVNAKKSTPDMGTITNTCEYCGKAFMSLSILNKHIKAHTMLFQCDKCEKKYVTRDSLKVHRRIHTGEMPYLCSHCGRGFRSSCIFKSHVRIHTGERRYKCHICGKTSIQHLARHMRMHRGEKNYLCTVCGKAFLSSGELRLHMRFHTGERPYTCKHCGRGFRAKCQLTVHIRQHTGESPYRCPVCPKSFHTLNAQKRHVLIHSNKKSFQCLKCGKIFRQEVTFKMHVQTHK